MGKSDDDDDAEDRRIRKLFKRLRKSKKVVRCGEVYVDIEGAIERRTACTDGLCMAHGRGKRLTGKTCCTTFRVPLETDDVERVSKVVDEVKQIRDVTKAIEKAGGWWHIDDDQAWLEDRPDGACVFLSAPKNGPPLCTIHEWALETGREFRDHKPETCCLFPLYLLHAEDDEDGEVLVTSYGSPLMREAEPDEADDIKNFDCLHPPKGQGRSILQDQEGELRYRLGSKRWDRVLGVLREAGYTL